MTLALHSPNRGSVKVGSYASETDMWSTTTAVDVPHFVRSDSTGKRLAFFDKSGRIVLRSASGAKSIQIKGIQDEVRQFRWLKNSRGFVVTTVNTSYIGFLKSESPKTITFKPLLPNTGEAHTSVRTIGTGVVVSWYGVSRPGHWEKKVFFVPVDGARAQAPQQIASDVVEFSVLAGNRILVRKDTEDQRAPTKLLTFATEGGKPRLIATTMAPRYIKNWATGSKALAYVAASGLSESPTLYIHADKLVKARLPKDWQEVPVLWANKDGSRYLIGSDYQLGLWDQNGKRLWSWSPPKGRRLTSARFAQDGSVIASAGLKIYRVKDGKGRVILKVKGQHPERLQRNNSPDAYSFVDHPSLMDSGKIGYSLVHVDALPASATSLWPGSDTAGVR